jgi:hypothetical protein
MTVSKRGETSELRDADLAAADCVSWHERRGWTTGGATAEQDTQPLRAVLEPDGGGARSKTRRRGSGRQRRWIELAAAARLEAQQW